MAHPLTLPALALFAVAGIAAGVQLGRAAVADINPLYFNAAEGTKSFAALSPNRASGWAEPPVRTAAADATGLGSGCVGCATYPEEYYPEHDWTVEGGAASAAAPREEPSLQYALYEAGPEAELAPELAAVERYAAYPVSAEEAAAETPVEEDIAAAAEAY